jgi:hypothetical protein
MTRHTIQQSTYPKLKKRKRKDWLRKLNWSFCRIDIPSVKWSILIAKFLVARCPKLDQFFVCTNCRERSVKTNPNWMHKSNTLELVSWWVQQQKQEDKCKPKRQCKCKNESECYRSFFCDHNNNRLLEINHN